MDLNIKFKTLDLYEMNENCIEKLKAITWNKPIVEDVNIHVECVDENTIRFFIQLEERNATGSHLLTLHLPCKNVTETVCRLFG